MAKSPMTKDDALAFFHSHRSVYSATPTNLKIIDMYVVFAVFSTLIQVYRSSMKICSFMFDLTLQFMF
ncbi:putative dolichyl-diphosphooligosaccharide--protein glycotransferase [Helianthus annuus]|nr:putative dolichyl-diphosphooligosaccharide--protein glycotransferase [Helianthus annuus]KAJ0618018.1 putative dolichyl-diphosphooligosaccharide--protein glycotransferase [Helianthus annuus]